jgi:hypothetical protein
MSVSTNLSWGTISTSCTLTYGDANQYYLSGSTSFTLNIDNPTAISELFLSDDKSLNIVNDTIATPLVFYTDPSSADLSNAYQDVYVLLTNRYVGNYGSETWINFNSLDFTSMYATGVNASAGTSGNKGTITISALSGSTIYSGSLNITWQSWNYIPV